MVQADGGDDTGIEDKEEVKAWSLSGQATTTVNHEGVVCPNRCIEEGKPSANEVVTVTALA